MNKLKEIRSFEELKDLITQNKDKIKKQPCRLRLWLLFCFFGYQGEAQVHQR